MKSLIAFTKKEILGQWRTFKVLILAVTFVIFGVMNPAVVKITPWLLDLFADSLQGTINITPEAMTAVDSWVQFFKNIPMALIVVVLLEGNILVKEYGSGTLVLSLTKGLDRYKVVVSKIFVLVLMWTVGYWLCFGITYGLNEYFWDNSVAKSLMLAVFCWWLFGVMVMIAVVIFSTVFKNYGFVLLATGGSVLVFYLISLLPKVGVFMPTTLMGGTGLILGVSEIGDYIKSIIVTVVTIIASIIIGVLVFNKKQI